MNDAAAVTAAQTGVRRPEPTLRRATTCESCGRFPCACRLAVTAESLLIAGYRLQRLPLRVEPCVCGGPDIAAVDGDWDGIKLAIADHAETPEHQAWSATL